MHFLLFILLFWLQKIDASKCMSDVYSSSDGKVVIYDSVVHVPRSELFLIGPHGKLWIVPETPKLQEKTIFFPFHFQRGLSTVPRIGSTCTFSWGDPDQDNTKGISAESAFWRFRTTFIDFLHDPIRNINVAYCAIPSSAMQEIHGNQSVRVSVHLQPAQEGLEPYVFELPVCIPAQRASPSLPSTLPAFASLCCIIRDEARYLVEWIEYSRMIGVDHFFLYDHNSTDDTMEVRNSNRVHTKHSHTHARTHTRIYAHFSYNYNKSSPTNSS